LFASCRAASTPSQFDSPSDPRSFPSRVRRNLRHLVCPPFGPASSVPAEARRYLHAKEGPQPRAPRSVSFCDELSVPSFAYPVCSIYLLTIFLTRDRVHAAHSRWTMPHQSESSGADAGLTLFVCADPRPDFLTLVASADTRPSRICTFHSHLNFCRFNRSVLIARISRSFCTYKKGGYPFLLGEARSPTFRNRCLSKLCIFSRLRKCPTGKPSVFNRLRKFRGEGARCRSQSKIRRLLFGVPRRCLAIASSRETPMRAISTPERDLAVRGISPGKHFRHPRHLTAYAGGAVGRIIRLARITRGGSCHEGRP
jgi:hypothetical protein